MTTTPGSPDIYERDGRRFKTAGIGTAGWHVEMFYHEIDTDGEMMSEYAMPLGDFFPDPAVVAAQQARQEAERQRIERAAEFPIEGISGEWDDGLTAWRTDGDESEYAYIKERQCHFCESRAACVSVACDYDDRVPVCRDCLGKIFDVFETHTSE